MHDDRVYSFGNYAESHVILLPSIHDVERSSFPGLVPHTDMVNSESLGRVKAGVIIGCQVNNFTHNQVGGIFCCLVTNLHQAHRQHVNFRPFFSFGSNCQGM